MNKTGDVKMSGFVRLWNWFSLSRASWLTIPRSMMHEMPDEWQNKMAELLEEWDATWETQDMPTPTVLARGEKSFTKWPDWLLNYRHPDIVEINKLKVKIESRTPNGGEGVK